MKGQWVYLTARSTNNAGHSIDFGSVAVEPCLTPANPSLTWIPMPAFGQGPLKQERSGRSNFIAGFVQPKQSVDGGFLAFTIDLGVDDDELKEIKKCRID